MKLRGCELLWVAMGSNDECNEGKDEEATRIPKQRTKADPVLVEVRMEPRTKRLNS